MSEQFNSKLYEALLTKSIEKTISENEISILAALITLSLKFPEIAIPIDKKLESRLDEISNKLEN